MTDKQLTFDDILIKPEYISIEREVHNKRLSGEYQKEDHLPNLNKYFHNKDKKITDY